MNILGIDPGATTGWCVWCSEDAKVISSGQIVEHRLDDALENAITDADMVAIERPKGYGPTRPQMVECGIVFGSLREKVYHLRKTWPMELFRMQVCEALTSAMHGVLRVRNDATAWAALVELHGGAAEAKRRLAGVRSHSRAALAVAVAAHLMSDDFPKIVKEGSA